MLKTKLTEYLNKENILIQWYRGKDILNAYILSSEKLSPKKLKELKELIPDESRYLTNYSICFGESEFTYELQKSYKALYEYLNKAEFKVISKKKQATANGKNYNYEICLKLQKESKNGKYVY